MAPFVTGEPPPESVRPSADHWANRTRFLLFTSLWTIVFSIAYLVGMSLISDSTRTALIGCEGFLQARSNFLFSIASHVIWMFLTWLFWLAGAAAITSALGGGLNCNALPEGFGHCYQLCVLLLSASHTATMLTLRCSNSAEGFAWLNWIIATLFLAYLLFVGWRSARSGNGFGAPLV